MAIDFPGFVGPSYTSQSLWVDAERCVNWYPEQIESAAGKAAYALYPTPGFTVFANANRADTQPIRGLFAAEGRLFAMAQGLWEISSTGVWTGYLPGFAVDANPATMCSSGDGGNQLFITSGGRGYIFNLTTSATDGLTYITPVTMGGYMDGRFLAFDTGASKLRISDIYNGLSWPTTQFIQRSTAGDKWKAMLVRRPDIWMFGSQTTDVLYNAGIAPFPFAPRPDAQIPYGIAAPWSAAIVDNAPTWLSQTDQGFGIVLQSAGYAPTRISTHAMEFAISTYAVISDAVGWSYQDQGHSFYVLSFPTQGITWVYDAATKAWHERGFWNSTARQYEAIHVQSHVYSFGKHLVADTTSGNIYQMATTLATETDGTGIRRLRRTPHLSKTGDFVFHSGLQIDLEVGLGLISGQGIDPQVMLRWSNDGGKTFGNEHWQTAGQMGAYKTRVFWTRLGRARDRVYELVMTDPVPWRIARAFLDLEPGTD
jgi:hypothetical protein